MMKISGIVPLVLSLPVAAISACSPNQNPSSQPGTVPPVKSAAPTSSPSTGPTPNGQSLSAEMKTPDGRTVATATFDFTGGADGADGAGGARGARGYVTVTVRTVSPGILAPGLHAMHVHQIGKCEPNSVAPGGGPPGNFLSAGEHYQAPGHTGKPASGNLTSLEVRQDGSAYLVTTTDSFTRDDLLAGDKTALMLRGAQYSDQATQRVACGVIGTG